MKLKIKQWKHDEHTIKITDRTYYKHKHIPSWSKMERLAAKI